jgi:hypothetical protein
MKKGLSLSQRIPLQSSIKMIDFVRIIKPLTSKDTLNLFNLKRLRISEESGFTYYSIQGCKPLQLRQKEGYFELSGSLPYFWQGHNFSFSGEAFCESINYLSTLLGVGLWDSALSEFEWGVIVEVDRRPNDYILHHSLSSNYISKFYENSKPQDKGNFKWWESRAHNEILKLYDATYNINKKQYITQRDKIKVFGYKEDTNYLKFEVHYLHPERITLPNKPLGVNMLLADLANPEITQLLDNQLINYYKSILTPMKNLIEPTEKKDLQSIDIVLTTLVEDRISKGKTITEIRKELYDRINRSTILSVEDKKSRKRQISTHLARLKEAEKSDWDLTEKIEEEMEGQKNARSF